MAVDREFVAPSLVEYLEQGGFPYAFAELARVAQLCLEVSSAFKALFGTFRYLLFRSLYYAIYPME